MSFLRCAVEYSIRYESVKATYMRMTCRNESRTIEKQQVLVNAYHGEDMGRKEERERVNNPFNPQFRAIFLVQKICFILAKFPLGMRNGLNTVIYT